MRRRRDPNLQRFLLEGERVDRRRPAALGGHRPPSHLHPRRPVRHHVGRRSHPGRRWRRRATALAALVRPPGVDGVPGRPVAARPVHRHRQAPPAQLRSVQPEGRHDAAHQGDRHVVPTLGARADLRLRPVRPRKCGPGPGAASGRLGPPPRRHVPDPLYRDLRRAQPGAGDRPRPGRRVPRRRDRCASGGTSTAGGQPAGRCRGAGGRTKWTGRIGYATGRVRGGRALVVLAGHPASPVRGLSADAERRGHLQQRRGTTPAPGGRHRSDPATTPPPGTR